MVQDKMLEQIHRTSLRILEKTGIRIDDDEIRDLLAGQGVRIKGDIACFTEAQVRQALSTVPGSFCLHGRNPGFNPMIGGDRTHYLPSFGAPYILEKGKRRDAVLDDYIKMAKLIQMVDEMPINGGILVQPADVPADKFHLILLYAAIRLSDKALMGMSGSGARQAEIMGLLEILYGKQAIEERAVMITLGNTTSPLILDGNLLQTLKASAWHHQPMIISPGPMAGSTGPIHMAGDIALANAEILAAVCCSQAVSPGTPMVYGLMSQPSDMKTCEIDTGSPAAMIGTVMAARLAQKYGIPSRGGTTPNARDLSVLSGVESMMKNMAASTAGINLIIHSAGIMDKFNGVCFDQFMVDVDVIRRIEYFKSFFSTDARDLLETVCLPEIESVGPGGNFLMAPSTVKHCRTVPYSSLLSPGSSQGSRTENEAVREAVQTRMADLLDQYRLPETDPETLERMRQYLKDCRVPGQFIRQIDQACDLCRKG